MLSTRALRTVEAMEEAMQNAWPNLKKTLTPIKSNDELEKRIQILDAMLDKVGEDENHPLALICDSLGRLIEDYEKKALPIKESSPSEILAFLMKQEGLRQKDLNNIIPQSNLSAFFRGKRSLSLKQIVRLSARFRVSPAVFLPSTE